MSKPRKEKSPPKRVLALPDLEQSKAAVLNTLTSKSGQRSYDRAITDFVDWYCSEPRLAFNRTVVLRYRIFLEQKQALGVSGEFHQIAGHRHHHHHHHDRQTCAHGVARCPADGRQDESHRPPSGAFLGGPWRGDHVPDAGGRDRLRGRRYR